MSEQDLDALRRAMALVQDPEREPPERIEQIEHMLADRSWEEVAHFAAYRCQRQALRLKPWESPPMYGHLESDSKAARLLQRMLDAGVSQFEPDPLEALESEH